MGYTTFGKFVERIAPELGKRLPLDRIAVEKSANDIRQYIHLMYENDHRAVELEECFRIQQFALDCQKCDVWYLGITLPYYMQSAEKVFRSLTPLKSFDRWREWKEGIQTDHTCRLATFDLGDGFPTELDICKGSIPTKLKVIADRRGDAGKEVKLTYFSSTGDKVEECLKLCHDRYTETEGYVKQLVRPGGVVLPSSLEGGITIAQSDGRILSRYSPCEHVPSYRRLKITGLCKDDCVKVVASAKFFPLYYETDVVETDNWLAIDELARFFRYNSHAGVGGDYESKAKAHEGQARLYLMGEKSRDNPSANVRQINLYGTGGKQRSGLRRNRRWR